MQQEEYWNPIIELLRDKKKITFLLYELIIVISVRLLSAFIESIKAILLAVGLLILGVFFIWWSDFRNHIGTLLFF